MYMTVTVGLWLTALSLLLVGPSPSSTVSQLNYATQMAMAAVIFFGTSVKIHGFLSGTRLLMPKRDLRDCYAQAAWAVIATNVGLGVYVGSIIVYYNDFLLSVLGGSIGIAMIVGALWNAWDFYTEIYRLTSTLNEEALPDDGMG